MDTGTHWVKYEIRKGETAPSEVWEIAHRRGRIYENRVSQGTYTCCLEVKTALEG